MIKQHLLACHKMKQLLVFDRLLSQVLLLKIINSLEIEMASLQHDALLIMLWIKSQLLHQSAVCRKSRNYMPDKPSTMNEEMIDKDKRYTQKIVSTAFPTKAIRLTAT